MLFYAPRLKSVIYQRGLKPDKLIYGVSQCRSCKFSLSGRAFSCTRSVYELEKLDATASSDGNRNDRTYLDTAFKIMETALATFVSLSMLGATGYLYHQYYQHRVLTKISSAFGVGEPALDLATRSETGKAKGDW